MIIGFADEDELEELAGDVAGLGGSVGVRGSLGRDYLVTGSIALDSDVFDDGLFGGDRQNLQAIVDHEFGHLVGLGHVKDPGELCAAQHRPGHLRARRPGGPGPAGLGPLRLTPAPDPGP